MHSCTRWIKARLHESARYGYGLYRHHSYAGTSCSSADDAQGEVGLIELMARYADTWNPKPMSNHIGWRLR